MQTVCFDGSSSFEISDVQNLPIVQLHVYIQMCKTDLLMIGILSLYALMDSSF